MRSTFIIAATLAFCAAATAQPLPGTPATEPCATCGVVDEQHNIEFLLRQKDGCALTRVDLLQGSVVLVFANRPYLQPLGP